MIYIKKHFYNVLCRVYITFKIQIIVEYLNIKNSYLPKKKREN